MMVHESYFANLNLLKDFKLHGNNFIQDQNNNQYLTINPISSIYAANITLGAFFYLF